MMRSGILAGGEAIPIKFGTDGWRAIIAEDFTFDNVRLCAQAWCRYLQQKGKASRGLVIGYDTRYGSDRFAQAAAEVAAANDIAVALCDRPAPTPVVSHTLRHLAAGGGIVITASHNPGEYNGFKIKDENASSAPQDVVDEVESYLPEIARSGRVQRMPFQLAVDEGRVRMLNPQPDYEESIRRLVTPERLQRIRDAGLSVMVDSMYGAGAGYFKRLISGGPTKVVEYHGVRNPGFPGVQPEPISRNLKRLEAATRRNGTVGLATDGDADRLGVVDEHGTFVTQLQVYALLALYLLETRDMRGPLIKTITTTSMIYRLGERFGVEVVETDVGFKYVGPEMMSRDALMGGEESGGYGFRGHIPERDGILAGLYFLDLMVSTGKTPSQLIEYLYDLVGPHYYDRIDLHYPETERGNILQRVAEDRQRLAGLPVVRQEVFGGNGEPIGGVRFTLDDGSWLLVRFSGTEPVLRIYAECPSQPAVPALLDAGRGLTGL